MYWNCQKIPHVQQKDDLNDFVSQDTIKSFEEISVKHAPARYHFHRGNGFIVFYNLVINQDTGFPKVYEVIRIDPGLHVKLKFCGNDVPLVDWFTKGRNATLTRYSMLVSFSAYHRSLSYPKITSSRKWEITNMMLLPVLCIPVLDIPEVYPPNSQPANLYTICM